MRLQSFWGVWVGEFHAPNWRAGDDTLVVQGFAFTTDQPAAIFATASIETIIDTSGIYTDAVDTVTSTVAYTTLNDPSGANGTVPLGINNNEQIVGYYIDSLGVSHGFLYNGSSFQTIDAPSSTGPGGTNLNGINQQNQIAGWYSDGTSYHSFVYDHGTFTAIDDPSAGNNSSGTIAMRAPMPRASITRGRSLGITSTALVCGMAFSITMVSSPT